jgi:hypothetical protein
LPRDDRRAALLDFRNGLQRRFKRKPHTSVFPPIPDVPLRRRRPATKSADARRGAAHGRELHQAAGAVASVATDKRGVRRLQPHIHDSPRKFCLAPNSGRVMGHHRTHACSRVDDKNSVSRINCTSAPCRPHIEVRSAPGIAQNLEAARQGLQRYRLEH